MALTLTINFEGDQVQKTAPDAWLPVLQSFLVERNAERVAAGEAEFANLAEYFAEILVVAVKSYRDQQEEADSVTRKEAFDAAEQTIKDQVDALLGV